MSVGVITGSSSGFGKEFTMKIKKYYPNIDELWLISRSKDKLENIKNELVNDFNAFLAEIEENGKTTKFYRWCY